MPVIWHSAVKCKSEFIELRVSEVGLLRHSTPIRQNHNPKPETRNSLESFINILTLILISSVKFVFGPSFAYLNQKYDFTWLETNIYSIIGGMIGVTIFLHISEWLIRMWDKVRKYYFVNKAKRKNNPVFSEPVADTEEQIEIHYQYIGQNVVPPKKIFSRQSRRVVKIWKKYGLFGIAALTPVIFSIPIGTFFMSRYEKNRNKIFWYMFVSITTWSLLLTSFFQLTEVRSLHEILK